MDNPNADAVATGIFDRHPLLHSENIRLYWLSRLWNGRLTLIALKRLNFCHSDHAHELTPKIKKYFLALSSPVRNHAFALSSSDRCLKSSKCRSRKLSEFFSLPITRVSGGPASVYNQYGAIDVAGFRS